MTNLNNNLVNNLPKKSTEELLKLRQELNDTELKARESLGKDNSYLNELVQKSLIENSRYNEQQICKELNKRGYQYPENKIIYFDKRDGV